jgi:hypothetical protein
MELYKARQVPRYNLRNSRVKIISAEGFDGLLSNRHFFDEIRIKGAS